MPGKPTNRTSRNQQVKHAQNAGKVHAWPDEAGPANQRAYEIYLMNQAARPYDDWTRHDLFELARMSRAQDMAVDLQDQLDDEGYIVLGGKHGTTPIENPAGRSLATLNGTINAIARRLGMTTVKPDPRTAQTAARDAEAARRTHGPSEDDLDDRLLN